LLFIALIFFGTLKAQESSDKDNIKDFLMRVNKGAKYTSDKNILLEIKTKLPLSLVALKGADGKKSVYVMLQDKAGNNSEIQAIAIELDTQPPTNGKIVINEGAKYSNSSVGRVRLAISADGAYKMQISNTGNFADAKWEKYTEVRNWILNTDTDGLKKVFVRFGDRADNVSAVSADEIILDTTPPTGGITVNDGDRYTTTREVKLQVTSNDSDLNGIRITDGKKNEIYEVSGANSRQPMLYDWTLDTLDGKKYIRASFRDLAGNIGKEPAVTEIILDKTAPEKPLVTTDGGVKFSTNPEGRVRLKIDIRETPIGYTMRVSNNENFSEAEDMAFQSQIDDWILENSDDGKKSVYVKLIDRAGNESEVGKGVIYLDRSFPVAKQLTINQGADYTSKPVVDLKIRAEGADLMQFSAQENFQNSTKWLAYKEDVEGWILTGEEGTNSVFVRFRDYAGNVSEIISDSIVLQAKPPSGRLIINEGALVTTNRNRRVDLSLIYNAYASEMMISNNEDFAGAKWQPVAQQIREWQLKEDKDGPQRVFAKFKSKAGVESSVATDQILLDRTPPQNLDITINKEAKFVTREDGKVMLNLSATDADSMRIGFSQDLSAVAWEKYVPVKEIYLEGEDGEKTVFVQFKDENNNNSQIVSDRIMLGRLPPEPTGS